MFKITGYVVDAETDDILPGVAIYLSGDSQNKAPIAIVDDEGDYAFEKPPFGTMVEFRYPGYEPQIVDPAFIGFTPIMMVPKSSSTLGEVIVKAIKKSSKVSKGKPNYTLPIAVGSLAVIVLAVSFKF